MCQKAYGNKICLYDNIEPEFFDFRRFELRKMANAKF